MQLSATQLRRSSFATGTPLLAQCRTATAPAKSKLDVRAAKDMSGIVVSVQMNKTAVVQVSLYMTAKFAANRMSFLHVASRLTAMLFQNR